MFLSIVVTNYKTPDLLKLCLASIKVAGEGIEHEIIVIDSEAQEETEELIRESLGANGAQLVSFLKNEGYSKLVNEGLARSQGDYILVLNADMILLPDSLSKMINFLQQNRGVGIIGPQLLNFNGSIQDSCFRFYRLMTILYRRTFLGRTKAGQADLSRFLMRDFDRQNNCDVDWLLGAALMISRLALEKIGPMDERFFLYFEDVDWCRRFHSAGWRVVYFPPAKMHHYHGRGSKKSGGIKDVFFNQYTWIHLASAIKYFWKYKFKTEFDKK